ncbi:MAG: Holliday junction resolvase RuvX [Planctomycetes bacterium]|nr:Holliday junction resolvase RuvX [Planctomycetota bacterium]
MSAPGAIVAVDYGDKRTGLAACDSMRIAAMPIAVVETTDPEQLLEAIVDAVDDRNAKILVVGLPLHMSGHAGARVAKVRELCDQIRRRIPGIEIIEWDERLTTKAATYLLAEAGIKGKKRKQQIDAVAATLILRSYLKSLEDAGAR